MLLECARQERRRCNYADSVDEGIIVCGYKLKDMMYSELREYLPDRFEMLLIASQGKWEEGLASGVMGLTMPIKAYDLYEYPSDDASKYGPAAQKNVRKRLRAGLLNRKH